MRRPLATLPGVPLLALLLTVPACGPEDAGDSTGVRPERAVPHVYTTFYPTAYFTERIAGARAKVICPLPDDADPIAWDPPPDVIAAYQQDADLIVVNGAELEQWVRTVSLPRARVVDTARGFQAQWLTFDTGVTHTHGDGEGHTHEGVDGHTWMDPLLAIKQAQRIKDALTLRYPEHGETFQAGFDAVAADLRALHEAFEALGTLPSGTALYTTHAAYGYLGRRYGWALVDLNVLREPSESELAEIAARLEEVPGRHLLWEREPAPRTARIFEGALGLESVVVSPCKTRGGTQAAGGGDDADYVAAMHANVERLRPAFAPR